MTSKLIYPDYGINGSGANTLADESRRVLEALQKALEELRTITPHGRDYQCYAPHVYQTARAQHEARVKSLGAIVQEVADLAMHAYEETYA